MWRRGGELGWVAEVAGPRCIYQVGYSESDFKKFGRKRSHVATPADAANGTTLLYEDKAMHIRRHTAYSETTPTYEQPTHSIQKHTNTNQTYFKALHPLLIQPPFTCFAENRHNSGYHFDTWKCLVSNLLHEAKQWMKMLH